MIAHYPLSICLCIGMRHCLRPFGLAALIWLSRCVIHTVHYWLLKYNLAAEVTASIMVLWGLCFQLTGSSPYISSIKTCPKITVMLFNDTRYLANLGSLRCASWTAVYLIICLITKNWLVCITALNLLTCKVMKWYQFWCLCSINHSSFFEHFHFLYC